MAFSMLLSKRNVFKRKTKWKSENQNPLTPTRSNPNPICLIQIRSLIHASAVQWWIGGLRDQREREGITAFKRSIEKWKNEKYREKWSSKFSDFFTEYTLLLTVGTICQIHLKGKLGKFFYRLKVFVGPKLREVSKGNFHRKAPKLVKN